jgi:MFS family permease
MVTMPPQRQASTPSLSSQTAVMIAYFFLFGIGGASWLVRLPDVRGLLGVSVAQLGWLLFAGAVGAMTSLLLAGRFVSKFGARTAVITGFTALGIGQLIQAGATGLSLPWGVAVGGFVAGIGYGIGDVGINVEGAALEKKLDRSLLPQLHGAYSLGALAGAGLGTLFIVINFSVVTQMTIMAGLTTVVAWCTYRLLPQATGVEHPVAAQAARHTTTLSTVLTKRSLYLGLGIMGLSLAEGGANDWLALSVVDGYRLDAATAGITFAILTAAMVITRFLGGQFVDRVGRVNVLRATGLAGVVGIILVMSGVHIALAWIGAALWGVGVALGFPLFISAAADGPRSSRDVATVTSFGYMAFLVGPPFLGFLGQAWGLLPMFAVLAVFLVGSVYFAGATKPLPVSAAAE